MTAGSSLRSPTASTGALRRRRGVAAPGSGRAVLQARTAWAALQGAQASRGIFITTSRFTPDATQFADRVNVQLVLIDGPELASLMIEHNCGVIAEHTFTLKHVDENFFGDG